MNQSPLISEPHHSSSTNMGEQPLNAMNPPHIVMIPLMAQGHMIPMVDIAVLLAGRGVTVTFVVTPLNAARIQPTIDRSREFGLPIEFLVLPFPCAAVGLPEGYENADTLPSRDLAPQFFAAAALLGPPLTLHLRSHAPSCVISDMCHPWTHELAREFQVPRLVFHGFGLFALLCFYNIRHNDDTIKSRLEEEDVNRPFVVPGLPDRIELTRAQVPGFMTTPNLQMLREEMFRTEEAADGVVVNSSDDLEPPYKEWYEKTIGKKVWTIGPMSMYNRNASEMALRGNKAAIDNDRCLSWLDSMTPSSVLYVSFGSLVRTTTAQLIEIGLGLEASGHPFIWVIKGSDKMSEVEEWLKEFESRTSERGLIIKGWAPQVMILSHQAVGGFMTHCGWNSTLEGLSAGVPMITWPHFAEQFLNERLVVDVAKVGVPVGVKSPTTWGLDTGEVMVKREEVERAVRVLMDGGKDGEERRVRAKEMEVKARKTIEEGGSSFRNTTLLIQHIAAMETKIV